MARRQKPVVAEEQGFRARILGVALPCFALALTGMTVFNAFFGHGTMSRGVDVLATASTSTKSDGATRTLILKYDETVEDVQRELLAAGLFVGLVDGVDGPQTKVAVENYQRANQLNITGAVSPNLLEHILYTKKLAQAAKFTGSVAPLAAPGKTTAALSVPVSKPVAKAPETGGFVDLQKRLALLGYDPGTRSGQLDDATRSAILIFEMDHGLAMEGKVSKAFLNALKQAETKISANN